MFNGWHTRRKIFCNSKKVSTFAKTNTSGKGLNPTPGDYMSRCCLVARFWYWSSIIWGPTKKIKIDIRKQTRLWIVVPWSYKIYLYFRPVEIFRRTNIRTTTETISHGIILICSDWQVYYSFYTFIDSYPLNIQQKCTYKYFKLK